MANFTTTDYWQANVYGDDHAWWFDIMGCSARDLGCLQQWNTIHIAAIIPTIGSVLCSIYIIFTGTMYHIELKNLGFAAQLPVFISICDLLFEMGHGSDHVHNILTGYVSEGFLCLLFGCVKPFSINCQTAWALGTAYFLSHTIVRGETPNFGKYNYKIHIPCWGIPAIILVIGFVYDVYGIEGPWCGIKQPFIDLLMADLWVAIACLILALGYSATGYYLHKMMKKHFSGENEMERKNYDVGRSNVMRSIRILGLYPVAYFFQWLAYGLLKTAVIPLTYENVLWVVTTANTGGMLNFFIYYPLLLNQVKRKWSRNNSRTSIAGGAMSSSQGSTNRRSSNYRKGNDTKSMENSQSGGFKAPTVQTSHLQMQRALSSSSGGSLPPSGNITPHPDGLDMNMMPTNPSESQV